MTDNFNSIRVRAETQAIDPLPRKDAEFPFRMPEAAIIAALHAELAQARADTQAAVALVVERVVAHGDSWLSAFSEIEIKHTPAHVHASDAVKDYQDAIRALAPVDGLAEVARLRVVANSANQHWLDKLDAEADRDRLAAENAALQGQVKGLVEAGSFTKRRLETIADEAWNGDARDFKRRIPGAFAEFDAALAAVQAKEGGE